MLWKINKDRVKRITDDSLRKRSRALVAFFLAVLFFANLGAVGYIMVVHGEEYRTKAKETQLYDVTIEGIRGTIYDRNMQPLVTSTESWKLCVNPFEIQKTFKKYESKHIEAFYDYLAEGIAEILSIDKDEVRAKISIINDSYEEIARRVTPTQKVELNEFFAEEYHFTAPGKVKKGLFKVVEEDVEKTAYPSSYFYYESDNLRVYAQPEFAGTILGTTGDSGNGRTGIEYYYNSVLTGENGRIVTAKDSLGRPLESGYETVFDATEGNGVVSTIDVNIQSYLESALEQTYKDTNADSVYGIVMDVNTGAVLAMADRPNFDLSRPGLIAEGINTEILEGLESGSDEYDEAVSDLLYEQWTSDCINETYEPGSTFKIFTAAAVLEEGTATLNTTYKCTSHCSVKGQPYDCAYGKAHGVQNLTKMLMNSCNCAFIWLGQQLGIETYMKYFEAFGFSDFTDVDISHEAESIVHHAEKMSVVNLASTSFGQSFKITPLQLITATSAIANGGKLMKPYFVSKIVDADGNIISETEPTVVRNVISKSTAQQVTSMMIEVVESGTGTTAHIDGYLVAGKTGTAQKLEEEAKQKQEEEEGKKTEQKKVYVSSFVCFAPADDPQVAILVCVDNSKDVQGGGGAIAAPAAKLVLSSTLEYLGIEPEYTESQLKKISGTAPDLVGRGVSQAKSTAAAGGYTTRVVGSGDKVTAQVPAAGQVIPSGGVIVIYTQADHETFEVEVPDFTGLTTGEVNNLAVSRGINVVFSTPSDTKGIVAYSQNISAGTLVEGGTSITVYFKKTDISHD